MSSSLAFLSTVGKVLYSSHIFILLRPYLFIFIIQKNKEVENFLQKCNLKVEILYFEEFSICNYKNLRKLLYIIKHFWFCYLNNCTTSDWV